MDPTIVDFSVVKQKLIKTDEILQMYTENGNKLKKALQACKELKQKLGRTQLENDRCTFSLESLKSKYNTLDVQHKSLYEQKIALEQKYNQQAVVTQENIRDLEMEVQYLKELKKFTEPSPQKNTVSKKKIDELEEKLSKHKDVKIQLETENNKLRHENMMLHEQISTNKEEQKRIIDEFKEEKAKLIEDLQFEMKEKIKYYIKLCYDKTEEINRLKCSGNLKKLNSCSTAQINIYPIETHSIAIQTDEIQEQNMISQDLCTEKNLDSFEVDESLSDIFKEMIYFPNLLSPLRSPSPSINLFDSDNETIQSNSPILDDVNITNVDLNENSPPHEVEPKIIDNTYTSSIKRMLISHKYRKSKYLEKQQRIMRKKYALLKRRRPLKCRDNILRALQILKRSKINFTISNQPTLPIHCEDYNSKIQSNISQSLKKLLNMKLLGSFDVKKEAMSPAPSQMEFKNETKLYDCPLEGLPNQLQSELTTHNILDKLAELVSEKIQNGFSKEWEHLTTTQNSEFQSEIDKGLEHLFENCNDTTIEETLSSDINICEDTIKLYAGKTDLEITKNPSCSASPAPRCSSSAGLQENDNLYPKMIPLERIEDISCTNEFDKYEIDNFVPMKANLLSVFNEIDSLEKIENVESTEQLKTDLIIKSPAPVSECSRSEIIPFEKSENENLEVNSIKFAALKWKRTSSNITSGSETEDTGLNQLQQDGLQENENSLSVFNKTGFSEKIENVESTEHLKTVLIIKSPTPVSECSRSEIIPFEKSENENLEVNFIKFEALERKRTNSRITSDSETEDTELNQLQQDGLQENENSLSVFNKTDFSEKIENVESTEQLKMDLIIKSPTPVSECSRSEIIPFEKSENENLDVNSIKFEALKQKRTSSNITSDSETEDTELNQLQQDGLQENENSLSVFNKTDFSEKIENVESTEHLKTDLLIIKSPTPVSECSRSEIIPCEKSENENLEVNSIKFEALKQKRTNSRITSDSETEDTELNRLQQDGLQGNENSLSVFNKTDFSEKIENVESTEHLKMDLIIKSPTPVSECSRSEIIPFDKSENENLEVNSMKFAALKWKRTSSNITSDSETEDTELNQLQQAGLQENENSLSVFIKTDFSEKIENVESTTQLMEDLIIKSPIPVSESLRSEIVSTEIPLKGLPKPTTHNILDKLVGFSKEWNDLTTTENSDFQSETDNSLEHLFENCNTTLIKESPCSDINICEDTIKLYEEKTDLDITKNYLSCPASPTSSCSSSTGLGENDNFSPKMIPLERVENISCTNEFNKYEVKHPNKFVPVTANSLSVFNETDLLEKIENEESTDLIIKSPTLISECSRGESVLNKIIPLENLGANSIKLAALKRRRTRSPITSDSETESTELNQSQRRMVTRKLAAEQRKTGNKQNSIESKNLFLKSCCNICSIEHLNKKIDASGDLDKPFTTTRKTRIRKCSSSDSNNMLTIKSPEKLNATNINSLGTRSTRIKEMQSKSLLSSTTSDNADSTPLLPPNSVIVKRGRGRPRKYPKVDSETLFKNCEKRIVDNNQSHEEEKHLNSVLCQINTNNINISEGDVDNTSDIDCHIDKLAKSDIHNSLEMHTQPTKKSEKVMKRLPVKRTKLQSQIMKQMKEKLKMFRQVPVCSLFKKTIDCDVRIKEQPEMSPPKDQLKTPINTNVYPNKTTKKIKIVQNILIRPNCSNPIDLLKVGSTEYQISSQRKLKPIIACKKKRPVVKKEVYCDVLSKILSEMGNVKSKKVVKTTVIKDIPTGINEKQWRSKILDIAEVIYNTDVDMHHIYGPKPCKKLREGILTNDSILPMKIGVLLKKLLATPNEDDIPEGIVLEFKRLTVDEIIDIIIYQVSQDIHDKPDIKYYPAPLMTRTQRLFLCLLVRLKKEKVFENIIDTFLYRVQEFVLRMGMGPGIRKAIPLTRLFLSVCRLHADIHRMRTFCCEAFFYAGDLAIPIFFTVLTSWSEVFPFETDVKYYPIAKVLVQLVHLNTCVEPGYNLAPLKGLLSQYYGYPKERWNCDTLFEEIYHGFLANPSIPTDYAIRLFCKNKDSKWVYKKVNEYFKPLIYKIPIENVNFKATTIILMGKICRMFKPSDSHDNECLIELLRWFQGLLEDNPVPILQQSIQYTIEHLPNKDKKIQRYFEKEPSTSVQIKQ